MTEAELTAIFRSASETYKTLAERGWLSEAAIDQPGFFHGVYASAMSSHEDRLSRRRTRNRKRIGPLPSLEAIFEQLFEAGVLNAEALAIHPYTSTIALPNVMPSETSSNVLAEGLFRSIEESLSAYPPCESITNRYMALMRLHLLRLFRHFSNTGISESTVELRCDREDRTGCRPSGSVSFSIGDHECSRTFDLNLRRSGSHEIVWLG